jgi:hypothetical protein
MGDSPVHIEESPILSEFAAVTGDPGTRRELWLWSFLAVASLAVAGILALMLAVSRIPGIQEVFPWPLDFFNKGLVVHVVLSILVWTFAVMGALLQLAACRLSGGAGRLSGVGFAGALAMCAGTVLLVAAALTDQGEASLNNYIPVIIHPLYYTGLGLIFLGLALPVARLLAAIPSRTTPLTGLPSGAVAAGSIYLLALVCFALAWRLLGDQAPTHDYNEALFWGGGHVLQFVNVALLLTGWYVLGAETYRRPPVSGRIWGWAVGLLVLFSLVAPFLYAVFEISGDGQRQAFSDFKYVLGLPVLIYAAAALAEMKGRAPVLKELGRKVLAWKEPAFLCLALSAAVFALGGFLGFFVDGADTRTPAHYHGALGGMNLAFMGLFLVLFLPLLGRGLDWGRSVLAMIWLYAGGQVLQSIGLFLAGGYGVPRKVAGGAQGLDAWGAIAGMWMNGLGALIAVIGGVMFIWTVLAALFKKAKV